jgi:hypothetical protein
MPKCARPSGSAGQRNYAALISTRMWGEASRFDWVGRIPRRGRGNHERHGRREQCGDDGRRGNGRAAEGEKETSKDTNYGKGGEMTGVGKGQTAEGERNHERHGIREMGGDGGRGAKGRAAEGERKPRKTRNTRNVQG